MAATETPARPPAQDVLVREARLRPLVGLASLAAAILAAAAGVLPGAIYSGFPRVYVLDSIRAASGQDFGGDGLRTAQVLFIHDKALPLLGASVVQALMVLLVGAVLVFLLDAAQARGATTPRLARLLAMVGAVASAVGALLLQIGVMTEASTFAGQSDHSTAAAHDAVRGGLVVAGSGIGFFGGLTLAAAFVMIAIGAMRVGLLTRFVGVLGAICGVLLVLGPATGSSTFIVQTFWLVMVGVLLLGRWPRGTPPAWAGLDAIPWMTQQQVREARAAGGGGPAPARAAPAPAGPGVPGAARRKRKRRG
ncbi:hypothetical protein FSW04_06010 [Baekduia soli]|uniref:DUF4386 family protein n=1 Tax=Baekduia soli TaxID=496014 RepID=A0A5B8U2D9_9ACTN|nr:hypothetical protein [Baekduia soli]QEC47187.1 hypothetical protein FSW04_06010 [Baekduia soli]